MEKERSISWNPWGGCHKISSGCQHCYMERIYKRFGRDPFTCKPTGALDYPLQQNRKGEFKLPLNSHVMVCFTSDFLLEDADEYRRIAWDCIRKRKDCTFEFITKRIDRMQKCLPYFWDEIKYRVTVCSTVENQEMADYRIPILLDLPLVHRELCCEPLLEEINIEKYLKTGLIEDVIIGGESGSGARQCDYKWVKKITDCCKQYNIPHCFKQTGARFIDNEGSLLKVARCNQYSKAKEYKLSSYELFKDEGGELNG